MYFIFYAKQYFIIFICVSLIYSSVNHDDSVFCVFGGLWHFLFLAASSSAAAASAASAASDAAAASAASDAAASEPEIQRPQTGVLYQ